MHHHRAAALTATAATLTVLTACSTSDPPPATPEPMMTMNGTTMPMSAMPAAAGPSDTARMICSPEIRRAVATALALPQPPPVTDAWTGTRYTCTYHLTAGPLTLSVTESSSNSDAEQYLRQREQQLRPGHSLTGMAGLGNPGYQAGNGTVAITKDAKTLEVDPTGLPPTLATGHPRADLAYEIATDVLGCWTGH